MNQPPRRAILIPVKDLSNAKTRLNGLLSQRERHNLAWVLLEGVLEEIIQVGDLWEKVVVTSYAPVVQLAKSLGFRVLFEEEQVSESHSVDRAGAQLQEEGVAGVLRIPLDLPLFNFGAMAPVFKAVEEGAVAVLVPSRDRFGTNALYRSPPTLFPSQFGPDSLRLHEEAARKEGIEPVILPIDALALDIDDPADLSELLRRGTPCPALDFLHDHLVPDRLADLSPAKS